MMEPKWVLSMGVCASSGGMFNNYAIVQGVDQIVPVDVYAPGCPPGPETLMHAILTLHEKVRTNDITRRPDRWTPGDAGGPGRRSLAGDTDDGRTHRRKESLGMDPGSSRRRASGHSQAQPRHRPQRGRAAVTGAAEAAGRPRIRDAGDRGPAEHRTGPLDSGGGGHAPGRPVQEIVFPTREQYLPVVQGYRDDGFEMCIDLCGVDYLTHFNRHLPDGVPPERFEVVVNLLSLSTARRVRLRVQLPESDLEVASIFDVYPGVEAMEREAFDMFGIIFDGPSGSDPDPDARGLGGPSPAQGLRGGSGACAVQRCPGTEMTDPTSNTPEDGVDGTDAPALPATERRSLRPRGRATRTPHSPPP